MKLGRIQKGVLENIAIHGWYYPGCGWTWDGDTVTVKVCETLIKRGLVKKIPLAQSPWHLDHRYELTKAGEIEADQRGYTPPYLKFGYAYLKEKDAIRKRLVASGMTDLAELHFAVEAAFTEAHKNDSTLRERQEAKRLKEREKWLKEEAKKPRPPEAILFTVEELERLVEHFEHANDPVSAAIGQKAKATLMACGRLPA